MQRRPFRAAGPTTATSPLRTLLATALACAVVHLTLSATMLHTPQSAPVVTPPTPSPTLPEESTPAPSVSEFRSPETVIAGEPYHPVFVGWAKKIYPLPKDQASGDAHGCVAWRQTGSCDPDGPREAFFDLPCTASVPSGRSGYCECGSGAKKGLQKCTSYESFQCADVCSAGGGGDGDSGSDAEAAGTARQRLEQDGHVVVEGRLVKKRTALDQDVRKAQQVVNHKKKQRNKRKLLFHRLADQLAPRQNPTDAPTFKGAAGCVGFQQTHDCSPFGPMEANQRACDAVIPSGVSGYCMCLGGYRGPGVGCDHVPFTCHDGCDPKMAEQMDEMLLGGEKAHFEADDTASDAAAPSAEAADVAAAAIAMAQRRDEALLTYGNGAPVRALDRVKLSATDKEEVARLQHEARARAAEVELADEARRRGDMDSHPVVAGGGPSILVEHEAFDADLAHAIETANAAAQKSSGVEHNDAGGGGRPAGGGKRLLSAVSSAAALWLKPDKPKPLQLKEKEFPTAMKFADDHHDLDSDELHGQHHGRSV